jgi:hypothetical protein
VRSRSTLSGCWPRLCRLPQGVGLLGLIGGCASGDSATPDSQIEVVNLDEGLGELTLTDAEAEGLASALAQAEAEIPSFLPEKALQMEKRVVVIPSVAEDSAADVLDGQVTVANVGPRPVSGRLICTTNWKVHPCLGAGARSVETTLPAHSAVQHRFAFEDALGGQGFFFFMVDGDRKGPQSTSVASPVTGPQGADFSRWPARSAESFAAEPPHGGCGFVDFDNGDVQSYRPLEVYARSEPAAVIAVACEEFGSVWLMPLLFRNRSELVEAEWNALPVSFDRSLRFPIPPSVVED